MPFKFSKFFLRKQDPMALEHVLEISTQSEEQGRTASEKYKLGTFAGVFTPTILSIFGVIMFLRLSWVVGEAGTWNAIVILVIANLITFCTVLSASTMATNMEVKTGGGYYIISRIMGLPMGSSIGLSLYLAQAFAVSFYVIGFAESVVNIYPQYDITHVALITLGAILVISVFGVGLAMKSQYVIMLAIFLALLSFFAGILGMESEAGVKVIESGYSQGMNFWGVFAVFFPAVTGILGGISLSGDLKNPAKNIPLGAISAVLISFVAYLAMILGFSLVDAPLLLKDSHAASQLSRWPLLLNLGIWGASLSSAIVSIISAPRTLQALALDKIVPGFLGRGVGKKKEPIVALALTALIALKGILLGDLNLIAPILTMFFLITYGMLNMVVLAESFVKNPSFRPTFRVHWFFSLLGALGSFMVMFLIDLSATLIALAIVAALFILFLRKDAGMNLEHIGYGFYLSKLRKIIAKISISKGNAGGKNWRPLILGFSSDPKKQSELVKFIHFFGVKKGFAHLYHLVDENFLTFPDKGGELEGKEGKWESSIFTQTCYVQDVMDGMLTISQVAGFGELHYNTVMMGWVKDKNRRVAFARLIAQLTGMQKNLLIFNSRPPCEDSDRIDIWWGGMEENGRLMLLFAHLLMLNQEWKSSSLFLKSIVQDPEQTEERRNLLKRLERSMRIKFEIEIIVQNPETPSVEALIRSSSCNARLVFIGLGQPLEGQEKAYIERIDQVLEGLPTTFLVKNGLDMKWEEI